MVPGSWGVGRDGSGTEVGPGTRGRSRQKKDKGIGSVRQGRSAETSPSSEKDLTRSRSVPRRKYGDPRVGVLREKYLRKQGKGRHHRVRSGSEGDPGLQGDKMREVW